MPLAVVVVMAMPLCAVCGLWLRPRSGWVSCVVEVMCEFVRPWVALVYHPTWVERLRMGVKGEMG